MRFLQQTPNCSDLDVVLDGQTSPAFRILLPEHITASNANLAAEYDVPGVLHTIPGRWTMQGGRFAGEFKAGRAFVFSVAVAPRGTYIDIDLTVKNVADRTFENLAGNVCLNLDHLPGQPDWANREFVAHDVIERGILGRYWYQHRTPTNLKAWFDGQWVCGHPNPSDPDPDKVPPYFALPGLSSRLYAIESEDGRSLAFQMWNVKCETCAPFPGNACFHLKPLFATSLKPGGTASIQGKAGVITGNRDRLLALLDELSGTKGTT